MLVEFIGSTGAGKTTVLNKVKCCLENSMPTTISSALATDILGLRGVTHPTVVNLVQEFVGFPFFVRFLCRYRAYFKCAVSLLFRHSRPGLVMINNFRSIERKLGMYCLARHMERDRVVLIDEGPAQAAHMFAFGRGRLHSEEIDELSKTLPLPDLLVYVTAPMNAVADRTLRRHDPPREMSSHVPAEVVTYAASANGIFDRLVGSLKHKVPILVIDNPDGDELRNRAVAESVATVITQHMSHLQSHVSDPMLVEDRSVASGRTDAR